VFEEPMAAAIGCRLPIHEPRGVMIIDIGGGTTDIAIISLSGVVRAQNIRIAGDHFNAALISFVRDEFKILIGEKTAEELKHAVCTLEENPEPIETTLRGRDLVTGLPREVVLTDADVREALLPQIDSLFEAIGEVLEITPPEVLSDVMQEGVYVTGGGALIPGMTQLLERMMRIPVHRAEDPLTSVVRGTGIILEDFPVYREVLLAHDDGTIIPRN
jgi:rod shape-determining protein MreB and related proteins